MFVTSGSPSRSSAWLSFFFFNDTATTEIYTLSLHDALPAAFRSVDLRHLQHARRGRGAAPDAERSEPPAAQDGAVHPQGTPHAVVLGALGPQPHGEARRRAPRRLPGSAPGDVVRRGAADAEDRKSVV